MNERLQLDRAIRLLSQWSSEIDLHTAIDFNDINKISEGFAANLLNAIYGYSLKNLNEETRNFPAVDLGDDVAKIAFQVTSTMNSQKIQSTLEGFVHHQLEERFTNGVRFFFLTTDKKSKSIKKSREKYQSIYNGFDSEKHFLTLHDLIQEIRNLQTKDKERFHKVLKILKESLDSTESAEIVKFYAKQHQLDSDAIKNLTESVLNLSRGQGIIGTEAQIEQAMSALTKGDTTKAENLFEQVTQKGEQEAKHTAQAYRNLGALAYLHDTQKALTAYRRATELEPDNAEGWNRFGHLLSRIGELDEAIKVYERVLELGGLHHNQEEKAAAYGNFGIIYQKSGDLDKAIAFYEQALTIHESLGQKEGMANQYGNLGNFYQKRGDLDKAIAFYEKSLAIEKELGRKEGMASDYGNLGIFYQRRGNLDKAIAFYEQALEIHENLGRKEGMANQYGNLGNVYQIRDDLDKAIAFYEQALEIHENLGHKEGMANDYGNLGNVYKIQGNKIEAKSYYRMSIELFEQLGSPTAQKVQTWLDALQQ